MKKANNLVKSFLSCHHLQWRCFTRSRKPQPSFSLHSCKQLIELFLITLTGILSPKRNLRFQRPQFHIHSHSNKPILLLLSPNDPLHATCLKDEQHFRICARPSSSFLPTVLLHLSNMYVSRSILRFKAAWPNS